VKLEYIDAKCLGFESINGVCGYQVNKRTLFGYCWYITDTGEVRLQRICSGANLPKWFSWPWLGWAEACQKISHCIICDCSLLLEKLKWWSLSTISMR
jgi:hypothetical protein